MMHDQLTSYLLGELSDAESAAFEQHLDGCVQCATEYKELAPVIGDLAELTSVAPPVSLRSQVLDVVAATPQVASLARRRRNKLVMSMVAVAAALAVVIGSVSALQRTTDPVDTILAAANAVEVSVGPTDAYSGLAMVEAVYVPDTGDIALLADGLEPLDDERTYQAWLITAAGPQPAGLFVPAGDGTVRLVLTGSFEEGTAVGITIEPAGGSPAPTGDVLFVGA